MASPAMSPRVQSVVNEFGVFWQQWPEFEQISGERRLIGLEVELIGSHASDNNHVDPSCPMCHHVRSVLLRIAHLTIQDIVGSNNSLTYNIDSHSNSVICLPALGNRSAVSVSINVHWGNGTGQCFETDLQSNIRTSLAKRGIHQR
jgi:hypothetical protein